MSKESTADIPPPEYWIDIHKTPENIADLKTYMQYVGYNDDQIQEEVDFRTDPPDFSHDFNVFEESKWLGIFVASYALPNFDYKDPDSDFCLDQKEPVFDLHLPYLPKELRNRRSLEQSRMMMGAYMIFNDLQGEMKLPKDIVGITYAKLGRVAVKTLGFNMIRPEIDVIPDDYQQSVREHGLAAVGHNPESIEPVIIHKPTYDFLKETFDQ